MDNTVVRCSCGQRLYRYNEKTGMPFGSKVGVCPGCGKQYFNEMNIEPASLDRKQERRYAREYAWGNNFSLAVVPFAAITYLLFRKADLAVLDDAVFILQTVGLFAVCYALCAVLKLLRYKKSIYPESEQRMADPDYAQLIMKMGGDRGVKDLSPDFDLDIVSETVDDIGGRKD